MRKRCHRRPVTPVPPRGLRPMLTFDQRRDIGIAHLENLDVIHSGHADEATLWQVVGGVLTWLMVSLRLQQGQPEMDAQMALVTRLVEHYRDTGRIEFTGSDYDLAKTGTIVMDLLAEAVDQPTAILAAQWSERRVERMSTECHA